MKIRKPTLENYDEINRLAVKLHDLHVKWRPDIFVHTDNIYTKEEFKDIINNNLMFIACNNDKVVGFILMSPIKEVQKKGYVYRKQIDIDALIVDDDFRCMGIGTNLLNAVIDYAKENGCTDIRLTVNEENLIARKAYEDINMKVKNIAYTMKI